MEYFYATANNEQRGPVSPEQLLALNLPPDTLVWHEGMPQWQRLDSVPELRAARGTVSPQPYTPQPTSPQATPTVQQVTANRAGPQVGQPFGQQPGQQMDPSQRANGMATASMVLGILSIVLICCYLNIVSGILAIVFSNIAKKQIAMGQGKGLEQAKAGMICGIIGLSIGALLAVFQIIMIVASH